jgi:hypothetical protein
VLTAFFVLVSFGKGFGGFLTRFGLVFGIEPNSGFFQENKPF